MIINVRPVHQNEMGKAFENVRWCLRHNETLAGYPFHDEIFADGAFVTLYLPFGSTPKQCKSAVEEVRRSRDLINHQVILVPNHWRESLGGNHTCKV